VDEKFFKYLAGFLFVIAIWTFFRGDKGDANYDVSVQTLTPASEGLDLKAVGELLKKAKTASDLEKLINSPEQGVNNLDLDGDGKADYISVTEYGSDRAKGFSLTTQPASGEIQEVATIEVEKTSDDEGNMQIRGNEQVYGQNHYYHSHFGFTDFLIMSYLFSPHRYWASPYSYGHYPNNYRPYGTVGSSTYSNRTSSYTSGSSFKKSSSSNIQSDINSPNKGKSAKSVRASLKNPTSSQKSFQARARSTARSGGFGRTSSSSRSGGFKSGK
jgi:hypothetical protein